MIAEVSYEALKKRYDQGWVCEMMDDVDALIQRIREAKKNREVKIFFIMNMSPHQINLQLNAIWKYGGCAQRDEYDAWDMN